MKRLMLLLIVAPLFVCAARQADFEKGFAASAGKNREAR